MKEGRGREAASVSERKGKKERLWQTITVKSILDADMYLLCEWKEYTIK